jgi:hypothetical protein
MWFGFGSFFTYLDVLTPNIGLSQGPFHIARLLRFRTILPQSVRKNEFLVLNRLLASDVAVILKGATCYSLFK